MKNKILGIVGVAWGGGILFRHFTVNQGYTNPDYQAGINFAAIFGAAMLVVGLYTFFKKS
ncbi:hypothetical protein ACFSJ3_14900 [Corallincola platygyrae]|uniref:Uncharacterized protein n=1 Tax=Corallincola platygyrae TaxID=1193278 RepID=A0ABW4XS18_9GAMM